MKEIFKKLFWLLSPKTKKFIFFIFLSILISGFLEMLGIAILVPLFDHIQNKLSNGDNLNSYGSVNYINEFFQYLNITKINLILLSILIFFILKNTLIFLFNYFQYKIIFSNDIWLRNKLLNKYLELDYLSYSKLRPSELIRNTAEQVGQISYGSLLSTLIILSELFVVSLIMIFIFSTLPIEQSILIISVFFIGLIPYLAYKNKLILLGKDKFKSISNILNEIQNIHNLKTEIYIYQLKNFFLKRVNHQSTIYVNSQINYNLISILPKGAIEISAVLILVLLIFFSSEEKFIIHEVGIIIASIFRITPSFYRISSSLSQLKFSFDQINILHGIVKELKSKSCIRELNYINEGKINFNHIEFREVSFSYDKGRHIINKIGLKIVKGDFVIIKGESGVGKTTLIKLLMGLLKPDKGVIYVDNDNLGLIDKSSWFNTLSYVPQKPTIIEGDLMDNICLGIDKSKVDTELYNSVLRQSQLTKLNNSLNGKIIMSDGSSISGGQKQRIAIARAIYRKSNIIFLDEPTSSLDQKNKDSIIELLDDINKSNETTVIIITHSDHFDGYSTNEIRL